ncbi:MAG TPA: VOC family protein [Steroidobacteraceae bacterium]|jgi:catechol 2,3-dioxygenase-like lactoylglutathione lyase family enzyme|nr:VOC family protein [Steroidobacteraceae bacterium]
MLQHVSIGVRNIATTKAFYDAAFAPLGYACLRARDDWLWYGKERVEFSTRQTDAPVAAHPSSGLHFCFSAPTRSSVDAFHAAAIANGGTDNGRPGIREHYAPNYYAAFVVDPDGYRLEAYCGADA